METLGGGAGIEGAGERTVNVVMEGRGMTWYVEFGAMVERATRWVRGQMV